MIFMISLPFSLSPFSLFLVPPVTRVLRVDYLDFQQLSSHHLSASPESFINANVLFQWSFDGGKSSDKTPWDVFYGSVTAWRYHLGLLAIGTNNGKMAVYHARDPEQFYRLHQLAVGVHIGICCC